MELQFINKTLFFPKQGIFAVGDLHLGYDEILLQQGIILPFNQLEQTEQELKNVVDKIGKSKIKKIILLGDIKHYFKFEKTEKFYVRKFMQFLEELLPKAEIVIIRGNHDRVQLLGLDYKDFYVDSGIIFTHGNKLYDEILGKDIKMIVISHIHPAVWIKDKTDVKREKFKAFLVGKFKRKKIIVVPSFFPLIQGTEINDEYSNKPGWSILTKKQLQRFEAYVVNKETGAVLDFGFVGELG